MKLVKPSFRFIDQEDGMKGVLKQIEKAGRVSYKSENKMNEYSYEKFVNMLINSKHLSPLEFGTIYLELPSSDFKASIIANHYINNKYSKYYNTNNAFIITTNFRVIRENGWEEDLQYMIDKPKDYPHKRICVKIICDRSIMCELTRHRSFSFMIESTRYNNYTNNKFENQCTFIIPCWLKNIPACKMSIDFDEVEIINGSEYEKKLISDFDLKEIEWLRAMHYCETSYSNMISFGCTPQEARSVLPNSLKTEIFMCGFIEDWKHFFELRCDGKAHPQMREIAVPLKEEFKKRYEI